MKEIEGMSRYARALAKMHLVSTGVPYDDLDKPIIGIVNSWNEIVPGHVPLRQVAEDVKAGVWEAGGLPLEFNTIAICDGIAQGHKGMRYSLPSRTLIADSIEAMVLGHDIFDGLCFVTACDKITPAMLIAAARLDLPAVFATGGPMNTNAAAAAKKAIRQRFLAGKIDERALVLGSLDFYPGPGICPYLGTANTMLVVAETLGLMLPYASTAPFGTAERRIASRDAGRVAVEMANKGLRPSDVLSRDSFLNAVRVVMAIGGSLNTLLHLPAVAEEARVALDWADFDRISREVPHLVPLTPNGPFSMVDFHGAGAVPGLLAQIAEGLKLSCRTVDGTLDQRVSRGLVRRPEVIRPVTDPWRPEGGIAILTGNLAPEGALVKQSAVRGDLKVFSGPARVFDSEEECISALEKSQVEEGDVLIVRYEGARGGPGMREMHRATEYISRYDRLAIVTDGRFSGATAGLAVGYVRPEAYEGGPLALVESGDQIIIDLPGRRITVRVDEATLARRKSIWRPVVRPASRLLASFRDQTRGWSTFRDQCGRLGGRT